MSHALGPWFSTRAIFPLQETFWGHDWNGWKVEARNAAEHLTTHRIPAGSKEVRSPRCPWGRGGEALLWGDESGCGWDRVGWRGRGSR